MYCAELAFKTTALPFRIFSLTDRHRQHSCTVLFIAICLTPIKSTAKCLRNSIKTG